MSTQAPVLSRDQIPPDVDRRNGLIFIAHNSLLYFAAPVIYVGVVQGALADKQAFTGAASDQVDRVVAAVDDLVGRYPEAARYTSGAIL